MNMKLVERLYNRRFWLTLGMTSGLTVYFSMEIARPYFADMPVEKILTATGFFGLAACMLCAFILGRGERIIRNDYRLREALNDERMRYDRLKACKWGCATAMVTAFLIGGLPVDLPLTVRSAGFIILLATFLGTAIPLLIYMKK